MAAPATSVRAPWRVQITEHAAVPEAELARRIAALEGGPPALATRAVVLVRDPELTGRELADLARRVRGWTRAVGARLWINDRLDVALLAEADGIHLGRRSVGPAEARRVLGDRVFVSLACHTPAEVAAAHEAGADACTLSPIFASPGKGPPLGLAGLREARALIGEAPGFVLLALGGVDTSLAAACLQAGADGVAAIRAPILVAAPACGY